MALFLVRIRGPAEDPGQAEQVASRLKAECQVEPETSTYVASKSGRYAVWHFGFTAALAPLDAQAHHESDDDGVTSSTLFWGYGVPDSADVEAQRAVTAKYASRKLRSGVKPESLRRNLNGEWVIVHLTDEGTVLAMNDPVGLQHLYIWQGPKGRVYLANRCSFFAAVGADLHSNPQPYAWLAAISYRFGAALPIAGARSLPPDMILSLTARDDEPTIRVAESPLLPARGSPRGIREIGDFDQRIDEYIQRQCAVLRFIARDEDEIPLYLSGGVDSRFVLALCHAAGLSDKLKLSTTGPIDHPDVVVASMLAKATGAPIEINERRPFGEESADIQKILLDLAGHVFQTEGLVSAWDLRVIRRSRTSFSLSGMFGAINKGAYRGLPNYDSPPAINQITGFDPLSLLTGQGRKQLFAEYDAWVSEILAGPSDIEFGDIGDVFYVMQRMPNWGGHIGRVAGYRSPALHPLNDAGLIRLFLEMTPAERRSYLLPWQVMHRIDPELTSIPLAGDVWPEALHNYLPNTPEFPQPIAFKAGQAAHGSWQFMFNVSARLRAVCTDLVYDLDDDAFWSLIDRSKLLETLRVGEFKQRSLLFLLSCLTPIMACAGFAVPVRILHRGQKASRLELRERGRTRSYLFDQERRHENDDASRPDGRPIPSKTISRRAVELLPGPSSDIRPRYRGELFHVSDHRVEGWIGCDPMSGIQPWLTVVKDDELLASAIANEPEEQQPHPGGLSKAWRFVLTRPEDSHPFGQGCFLKLREGSRKTQLKPGRFRL